MKKNETTDSAAPQEVTAESQTQVVEQPVAEAAPVAEPSPVPAPVAPEAPAQPVQQAAPTPVVANTTPNANTFAGLTAKIQSFGIGPIVTVAVVAILLVGGVILSAASASPKSVFKKAINNAYKGANVALDSYEEYLKKYDLTENAVLVSGDFKVDTNIDGMDEYELKKLSLGFNAGVDYKNEILSVGANLKGPKESIKFDSQYRDNNLYLTSSLFKEVVKIDSEMLSDLGVDIDFEEIKEEIKESQKKYDTDPETYDYLVKTIKKALIKSIDSEYMEKEKDEIDVLDKELKVTKYSYVLDEDALQDLIKKMTEALLEEEDFAKKFADAAGVEKKQVKELLKEMKKEAKNLDFDGEMAINLYTRGLFNSYAGLGIELEGKEYFSLYTDGKNVEFIVDDHDDSEYGTKMVVTMEKDGKGYKVEVKENKEKILEMNIKEATEEVVDADVTFYDDKEKQGTINVYFKIKESKNKFDGEYKFKMVEAESKEYVSFSGKYSIEIKNKLDKMKVDKAVDIDEIDTDKLEENIEKITEKDEVLGTIVEETMTSIEDEMLDLNYNGMSTIYSSDVANVLSKKRATVLYVGRNSYGSYSEAEAYDLLYNLKKLQEELDFYSYYLSEYNVSDDFETLVKDVQYVCPTQVEQPTVEPSLEETPTTDIPTTEIPSDVPTNDSIIEGTTPACSGYPAIYLIKDGKVQKAFRQTVSYNDLKAALEEIGIK